MIRDHKKRGGISEGLIIRKPDWIRVTMRGNNGKFGDRFIKPARDGAGLWLGRKQTIRMQKQIRHLIHQIPSPASYMYEYINLANTEEKGILAYNFESMKWTSIEAKLIEEFLRFDFKLNSTPKRKASNVDCSGQRR